MPKAEGRVYKFLPESKIDTKALETIKYEGGKQLIEYKTGNSPQFALFPGFRTSRKL